jgi:exopolysaccharide biosynthesis polyprenyl glycosylphosphotransferase
MSLNPSLKGFQSDVSKAGLPGGSRQGRKAGRAFWWELDLIALSVTMLTVLLASPLARHQTSLSRILAVRVSLTNFFLAACCLVLWRVLLKITRLHRAEGDVSLSHRALQIALTVTSCTGAFSLVLLSRHPDRVNLENAIAFWILAFLLFSVCRVVSISFELYLRPLFRRERQVLIVGSGKRGQEVALKLLTHPRWHYKLIGFVDNEAMGNPEDLVGKVNDLDNILMSRVVDEVIIALPVKSKYDEIQTAITACERAGIQSGYSMDLFTTEITKRRSFGEYSDSAVVLHMVHNEHGIVLKRIFDVLGATFGLVVLLPLFVFVAVLVKITSPGPVIFQQTRYGLNKRTFKMYKFRSMVADAEVQQSRIEHLNESTGPVFKIRKDPRITPAGRFIRKTSIDELPQLYNVLRGDMSLVGPRPLPGRDVDRFSEASLMRRFSVKPGLTGLWQVSGRSNTAFSNWMKLDLEYIDQWTILLDVKILARTFPAVLKKDGAV